MRLCIDLLLTLLILACLNIILGLTTANRFYNILGIPKNSDDNAIKKAYRKLAMKYHPDKNPDDRVTAEKKFKEINEAYETLSDKNKRAVYDSYGEDALKNQQTGFNYDGGFSTHGFPSGFQFHFETGPRRGGFPGGFPGGFMGGSMADALHEILEAHTNANSARFRFSKQFDDDIDFAEESEVELSCSLEELYNGCKKVLKLRDYFRLHNLAIPIEKVFEIEIAPGWKNGTRLLYQKSQQFPKTVIFVIVEQKHRYFRRVANDLIWNCKLTAKQVESGVSIKLPLLDNSVLDFNTTDLDIHHGYQKIFKGMGMPSKRDGKGDLKVIFEVR